LLLGRDQQITSGGADALFRKAARSVNMPTLPNDARLRNTFWHYLARIDERDLQSSDYVVGASLARSDFGDFFHPLRVFEGQLIYALVVGGRLLEAHQAFFEASARHSQVNAIGRIVTALL